MSTNASDAGPAGERPSSERFAALHVADAAMVIYDLSNHHAWVQSDLAVSLDGMV